MCVCVGGQLVQRGRGCSSKYTINSHLLPLFHMQKILAELCLFMLEGSKFKPA